MQRRLRTIPALAALLAGVMAVAQDGPPVLTAPPEVSSTGVIAPDGEPGERLVVRGRVFSSNGTTPMPGVILYAYQTDRNGEYKTDSRRVARLHGWAKTDANGRFEFRTVRPGSYPNRRIAAHIHITIYDGGVPLQWVPSLLFEGDPLLSEREKRQSDELGPRFASIRALTRDAEGTWHATFDIRAAAESNYPAGTEVVAIK